MMKPQLVDRSLIDRDPDQPRRSVDPGHVQNLADSIRHHGLLQPMILYEHEERYRLVDGHMRFEATGLAEVNRFMALVLTKKPDAEELLLVQLAANSLRSDLKPSEQALAFQRLQQLKNWTHGQLAEAMHISRGTVTQILSLLSLPVEAQALVDSGKLAKSTAYAISREPDEDRRGKLLEKAVRGELRRDDAAQEVSQKPQRRPRFRSTFRVDTAEITVVSGEELEIEECQRLLLILGRECRKASRQHLNLKTLERMLADQAGQDA